MLILDLGFNTAITVPVRLRGVDCPELPTRAGVAAKAFATGLLEDEPLIVETYKGPDGTGSDRQTFARYVADVWLSDGTRLADRLLEAGHATVLNIR